MKKINLLNKSENIVFFIKRLIKAPILLTVFSLACGCVTFYAKPISPSKTVSAFEVRTLESSGLKKFLETNLHHKITPWPLKSWDFQMLTLTAFYYHPDLDVARSKWDTAKAGEITAGGRPNPSVGFAPEYVTNSAIGLSPWILGFTFDIPIETAGKRGYRINQARYLSEAARLNIAIVAWQVRSNLKASLYNLYAANQAEDILKKQLAVQEKIVKLLEQRMALGEISQPDITQAHISLVQVSLSLRDVQKQCAEARVKLTNALGLPAGTLDGTDISFDFIERLPADLTLHDICRQALFNRADILSALAEYAASESALQLEIAKQYPDIHLGPGFTWDQESKKWAFGFSMTLPLFNRNQGPIAEAEAFRKEVASRFTALQSKVIGEINITLAGYHASLEKIETADLLFADKNKQVQSVQKMFDAGEDDRLALLDAQLELKSSELSRLDALVKAQQSLSLLEDAVQRPINSGLYPEVPEINSSAKEDNKP